MMAESLYDSLLQALRLHGWSEVKVYTRCAFLQTSHLSWKHVTSVSASSTIQTSADHVFDKSAESQKEAEQQHE